LVLVQTTVAERVLSALERIAPTHREAAHQLGLDPTKLSKSLNGVRRFTVAEVTRIADLARTDVRWLLDGQGSGPAEESEWRPAGSIEDARRRRYLEATWELISERGVHAVRVADIASASGTSAAAVHYHFATKQEALTAAMTFAVERAFERQRDELRGEDDAVERIHRLIDSQVPDTEQVRREWSIWLQFWSECALRPELRPVHHLYYARWREAVERTIRRGREQGVFRPVDAAEVAIRFTSLADGLGIQVMTGSPAMTPSRMRELLVRFVETELLFESGSRVPAGRLRSTLRADTVAHEKTRPSEES
jgi:AcrR family transcriptional regulator